MSAMDTGAESASQRDGEKHFSRAGKAVVTPAFAEVIFDPGPSLRLGVNVAWRSVPLHAFGRTTFTASSIVNRVQHASRLAVADHIPPVHMGRHHSGAKPSESGVTMTLGHCLISSGITRERVNR